MTSVRGSFKSSRETVVYSAANLMIGSKLRGNFCTRFTFNWPNPESWSGFFKDDDRDCGRAICLSEKSAFAK